MATGRTTKSDVINRRGELLAELFLNELGAKVVSRLPVDTVDLLAFFESDNKAMHIVAVEVKVKEPMQSEFPLSAKLMDWAANSNIPTMLLVVDPKLNKFGYSWLDEFSKQMDRPNRKTSFLVPLSDAEKHRELLLNHILGTPSATA